MKKSEQLSNNATKQVKIDQNLLEDGIAQLASEIRVLEDWLVELKEKEVSDSDSQAARKSYYDMLISRREMLSALNKHAKNTPRYPKS